MKRSDLNKIKRLHSEMPDIDDGLFIKKVQVQLGLFYPLKIVKEVRENRYDEREIVNDIGQGSAQRRVSTIDNSPQTALMELIKKENMLDSNGNIVKELEQLKAKQKVLLVSSTNSPFISRKCICGCKVESRQLNPENIMVISYSRIECKRINITAKIKRCIKCNLRIIEEDEYTVLMARQYLLPVLITNSDSKENLRRHSHNDIGFENLQEESMMHRLGYCIPTNTGLYYREYRNELLKLCSVLLNLEYVSKFIEWLSERQSSLNHWNAVRWYRQDLEYLNIYSSASKKSRK